ncbi:HAD family phosphatase [Rhodocytophaga aerolata]|uniref:HAD family phosphatase n=1 Tax=Rhodocytophaga aerolata TaxID=455078 RepID=A0ABT8RA97_9BACT|nr:HAD family phosphatase [Rhodocytophaga aerolata]MDO1448254.1 HAD family phosphatase [Rhodocytophaga aerolata]
MINTIIFDLGAVLIDWNPHYLYKKLFTEEIQMLHFLQNICTPAWNEEQDGGRPLQEATDLLVNQYPEHAQNIRHFYGRWEEMLGGAIEGTVDIFKELKEKDTYRFYALTNWSAETFPIARQRFEFLSWFDGIVVSGTEKNRKPFASFYQLLLDRYAIKPQHALFIDDNLRNIQAAEQLGIQTVHFLSPVQLRETLTEKGIL